MVKNKSKITINNSNKKGAVDRPIGSIEEDQFGLTGYVSALSTVIKECQTPMTISIQGDWGSGKTSFMSMVAENLKNDNIEFVEFNTWQYSKFNMDDMLALNLLNSLAQQLVKNKKEQAKLVKTLAKIAYAVANKYQSKYTDVELNELIDKGELATFGMADEVKLLKEKLNKNLSKGKRKVVFIDDLDRLDPKKAIDLLEVLQIFMTLDNCVFILAVDYEIVVQGFKEKMGESYSTLKSKNFFDKIIQLPFTIPVGLATGTKSIPYIQEMLKTTIIGSEKEKEVLVLAEEFVEIIGNSIGFNPRKIKRVMNGYWLLKLVINNFEEKELDLDKKKVNVALFYILCMQMAYENAYNFIASNYKIENSLNEFLGFIESDEENDEQNDEQVASEARAIIEEICNQGDKGESVYKNRFQSFMNQFESIFNISVDGESDDVQGNQLLDYVLDLSMTTANSNQIIEEKIGAYVQRTIKNISITDEEIYRCQQPDYTKETFKINYALFFDGTNMSEAKIREMRCPDGRARYYKSPIMLNGKKIYYTSQWVEKHRKPYVSWLERNGQLS